MESHRKPVDRAVTFSHIGNMQIQDSISWQNRLNRKLCIQQEVLRALVSRKPLKKTPKANLRSPLAHAHAYTCVPMQDAQIHAYHTVYTSQKIN